MFSKNLKELRKQKGLSQEALAMQMHVVRQTISKWEKGQSIPDADMLVRLADILDTSVSQLLGGKIENEESHDQIADRLAQIAEQLAVKNRRSKIIWKTAAGILIALVICQIIIIAMSVVLSPDPSQPYVEVVTRTIDYDELPDGTWECDGQIYRNRLEITGRIPGAANDTTFVYLSNIGNITFEKAWKASGLSSNTEDYFPKEEAVLVEWTTVK